jgi:hypothetical protein
MYWRVALLVLLTTSVPQAKAEAPDDTCRRKMAFANCVFHAASSVVGGTLRFIELTLGVTRLVMLALSRADSLTSTAHRCREASVLGDEGLIWSM